MTEADFLRIIPGDVVRLQDDTDETDGPALLFAGPTAGDRWPSAGTALPNGSCAIVLWAGRPRGPGDEGWALVLIMGRVGWVLRWDMVRVIVKAEGSSR